MSKIRWLMATMGAALASLALVLGGTVTAGADAATAATTPRPAPGQVAGAESRGGGVVSPSLGVFYQQVNHRLVEFAGTAPGVDLGGVLTSGPAAIERQGPTEFETEAVFARGADHAIWSRLFSAGQGIWLPWASLGGRALGAPTVSCVGQAQQSPPLIVYVRGEDGALWRRQLGSGWTRVGGALASDPGALPAVAGVCPNREDVFALGTDFAVWERVAGAWHRIGGRSSVAPTAVQVLPGGETDLFVRGTDNALWMNTRAPGATGWVGWHRVGGVLSSAPVATIFPASPRTRVVLALGSDGNLWQGRNLIGSPTWTWTQVP